MALSLDYRIEIPRVLARMQICELRRFYDEGEKDFNFGFNKLKAETIHLTSDLGGHPKPANEDAKARDIDTDGKPRQAPSA